MKDMTARNASNVAFLGLRSGHRLQPALRKAWCRLPVPAIVMLLVSLAGGCASAGSAASQGPLVSGQATPNEGPAPITQTAVAKQPISAARPLWLSSEYRDKDGKPFRFETVLGRPTIVNFFFSHCGSYCPAQSTALAELQKELHRKLGANGYSIVSVSLTPERDKLEEIRGFVGRFSIDEANWHFVTGTPEATQSLIQATQAKVIVYSDSEFPDVDHTTDVYVMDQEGNLTGSFEGLPLDERGLAEAIVAAARR